MHLFFLVFGRLCATSVHHKEDSFPSERPRGNASWSSEGSEGTSATVHSTRNYRPRLKRRAGTRDVLFTVRLHFEMDKPFQTSDGWAECVGRCVVCTFVDFKNFVYGVEVGNDRFGFFFMKMFTVKFHSFYMWRIYVYFSCLKVSWN